MSDAQHRQGKRGIRRSAASRIALYASLPSLNPAPPMPKDYNAADYKSWYQTKWWYRARAIMRRDHPLCQMCADQGKITPMKVVDHKVPHRGNSILFFNMSNLWSLCKFHHDSVKAAQEQRSMAADINGNPLVPKEGW